jgi:hypothetical protein
MCHAYDGTKLPVFKTKTCTAGTNCGFRVFVMIKNGSLKNKPTVSTEVGTIKIRCNLFPGDYNTKDDFVYLRGNAATVNRNFKAMQFCQTQLLKSPDVLVIAEEVDLTKLDSQGLKTSDNKETINACAAPTATGPSAAIATFFSTFVKGECNGKCAVKSNLGTIAANANVTAILKVRNNAGVWVTYTGANLTSKLLYKNSELISTGVLDNTTGLLKFNAPVLTSEGYTAQIYIKDTLNRYNFLLKDVVIPKGTTGTLSVPVVYMVTGSGVGCLGHANPTACWTALRTKFGNVKLSFKDAYTLATVPVVQVDFKFYRSTFGRTLSQGATLTTGDIEYSNIEYGYYNFKATKTGYITTVGSMELDESNLVLKYYMVPDKGNAVDVRLNIENSVYDVDLMLSIRSKNGSTCTVSPVNKYCAYAQHMSDVGKGGTGVEIIAIKQTTVSYYNAFTARTRVYSGTCSVYNCSQSIRYDDSNIFNGHQNKGVSLASVSSQLPVTKNGEFNWNEVETLKEQAKYDTLLSTTLQNSVENFGTEYQFWSNYCFTGYGSKSMVVTNTYSNVMPTAADCMALYPNGSKHALDTLTSAIAAQG